MSGVKGTVSSLCQSAVGPVRAVLGSLVRGCGMDTANTGKRDLRPVVAACEDAEKEEENDKSRRSIQGG